MVVWWTLLCREFRWIRGVRDAEGVKEAEEGTHCIYAWINKLDTAPKRVLTVQYGSRGFRQGTH